MVAFTPILLGGLRVATMPPRESGNWMDGVFDACVDLLVAGASALGISYNAINVWVFCIFWPLLTLALVGTVLYQRAKIRRLVRQAGTTADSGR